MLSCKVGPSGGEIPLMYPLLYCESTKKKLKCLNLKALKNCDKSDLLTKGSEPRNSNPFNTRQSYTLLGTKNLLLTYKYLFP